MEIVIEGKVKNKTGGQDEYLVSLVYGKYIQTLALTKSELDQLRKKLDRLSKDIELGKK